MTAIGRCYARRLGVGAKREGRSSVGCGDLIVIKAAPAYQAGDVVWHKACVTSASPTAAISASSSPCRKTRCRCAAAEFNVRVPAGNTLTVRIWCLSKWIEKGIESMSNDVCNSPWLSIRAAPGFGQRELGDDEACLFLVKAANEPATAANKIERPVSTAMGDELGPERGNSRNVPPQGWRQIAPRRWQRRGVESRSHPRNPKGEHVKWMMQSSTN